MMKIYADTDVCAWHLSQLDLEISKEIVLDSPAVFHMPFPYNKQFEDKVQYAVSVCTKVIILVSELHQESVKFIIDHRHPRIKYFICGTTQGCENSHWMDWFITTTDCYRNIPLLDQLAPYTAKSKYFDILLGWVKPHRTFVYDFINDNNLNDKVIMTYLKDRNVPIDQQGIWSANIPASTFNTITRIDYLNYSLSLSQLIPVDIYNQTAYSVVAETNADNHYTFCTEKIVKPILAERLFIVFSGQHYLRNLRSLGFKTYDGIIDETYDGIEDNDQRFKLACEQLQYLISQPQEDILAKIRPITEHNKRIMLETDWYGDFARELRAVLLAHTN